MGKNYPPSPSMGFCMGEGLGPFLGLKNSRKNGNHGDVGVEGVSIGVGEGDRGVGVGA